MALRRATAFNRKKWENPEASCGLLVCTSRIGFRKKAWWARGPALAKFDNDIIPDIEDVLRNLDAGYVDIFVRLYMIGTRQETSRPIIMVCCSNVDTRDLVEGAIRASTIPSKFPEFGIGASALPLEQPAPSRTLAGEVESSMAENPAREYQRGSISPDRKRQRQSHDGDNDEDAGGIQLVGRQIHFKFQATDILPIRRATGGAIILIGGVPCQLTASHIQRTQLQHTEVKDLNDCHFDGMSDDEGTSDRSSESDLDEALARGSATPAHVHLWDESPELSSRDSSLQGAKETPETSRNILQHSLRHLSRTLVPNELHYYHEVLDFACFRLGPFDHSRANKVIVRDAVGAPEMTELQILNVGKIKPGVCDVVVITARQSIRGTLISGPLYSWNVGFGKAKKLYPLHLTQTVQIGDSGSAVIDSQSGDLYGLIVQGCPGSHLAYMIAAAEIFEFLEHKSGFEVSLCTEGDMSSLSNETWERGTENPEEQNRSSKRTRLKEKEGPEEEIMPRGHREDDENDYQRNTAKGNLLPDWKKIAVTHATKQFAHSPPSELQPTADSTWTGSRSTTPTPSPMNYGGMNPHFTDVESRFILSEMIKTSNVNVSDIVHFIKTHGVQPDWLSMQLPSGRSMNQCLQASENMLNTSLPIPFVPTSRLQGLGSAGLPVSASPSLLNRGPLFAPTASSKSEPVHGAPDLSSTAHAIPSPGAPRKRGRPPKVEPRSSWQIHTSYPSITPSPAPVARPLGFPPTTMQRGQSTHQEERSRASPRRASLWAADSPPLVSTMAPPSVSSVPKEAPTTQGSSKSGTAKAEKRSGKFSTEMPG